MTKMEFGQKLREWRETQRYTGRKLAEMLGVRETAYRNWEAGRAMPKHNVISALRSMGFAPDEPPAQSIQMSALKKPLIRLLIKVLRDDHFDENEHAVAQSVIAVLVENQL